VDVSARPALARRRQPREALQLDVLAELAARRLHRLAQRAPAGGEPEQLVARLRLRVGGRRLGELGRDAQEVVGLRDEVRLAAELDDAGRAARIGERHGALGRRTPGALHGLREAALAQQLDRARLVAARVSERLLALHHAGPGLVPERLHDRRRDLRHLARLRSAFRRAF
jgi:hypothetical protein